MKPITLALVIAALLIVGSIALTQIKPSPQGAPSAPANNISIENGKQIIDITAKGGYSPRVSTAKAGIPTIIRFHTTGTFDCSSAVRIPSMGVSQFLPPTGTTDIAINNPQAGPLQGMCGMGMYPFQIVFE
jgi:Cu+-exporting ATPase